MGEGADRRMRAAVRAGLRLLEEQELKLEHLRVALAEGEAGGAATDFNATDYMKAKRHQAR